MAEHEQELIALGQTIRRLRRARHVSVEALAHKAGVTSGHLGTIERGHVNPRLATLYGVADALGITAGELLRAAEAEGTK